jgi:hypothetical protein
MDSDSVNLGSNPSSPAIKKQRYFLHNWRVFAGRKRGRARRPHKSWHSANAALTAVTSTILDLAPSAETTRCAAVLAGGRHRSRHSRFQSAPARSAA